MQNHSQVIYTRRRRKKDQRIQGILDAAQKVFFSKGYKKATMDEIALEAEISKPTIYQYFKTKDELYAALMLPVMEVSAEQFELIERNLEQGLYSSGKKLVKDIFASLLAVYVQAPDALRVAQVFFQQKDLIGELSQESRTVFSSKGTYDFELARRVVMTASRQGLIRDIDSYALIDIIWGLFAGLTQLEEIKATKHPERKSHLAETLNLATDLIIEAIALT